MHTYDCVHTDNTYHTHTLPKKEEKKFTGAGEMALVAHLEADFPALHCF